MPGMARALPCHAMAFGVAPCHAIFGGNPVSSWPGAIPGMQRVVMVKPVTIDADILEMPKMNKNGRKLAGHPTGGVPLIEMWGPAQDLEHVLHSAAAQPSASSPR